MGDPTGCCRRHFKASTHSSWADFIAVEKKHRQWGEQNHTLNQTRQNLSQQPKIKTLVGYISYLTIGEVCIDQCSYCL